MTISTINPETEELMPLTEAARLPLLRKGGRYTHPGTLSRWASAGVCGEKLETVRIGARIYTSREAVERFLSALNPRKGVANAR